jgi:dolichol kinase
MTCRLSKNFFYRSKEERKYRKNFFEKQKIFLFIFFKHFSHFWKNFQKCRKENIYQHKERILFCLDEFFCAINRFSEKKTNKKSGTNFFVFLFILLLCMFLLKTFEACSCEQIEPPKHKQFEQLEKIRNA